MQAGLVYTEKGFKSFTDWRLIQRGPRKGQVEVKICKACSTGIRYVKRIVSPDQIRRFPQK